MPTKFFATTSAALLGLTACLENGSPTNEPSSRQRTGFVPAAALDLSHFADCDEYRTYIADALFEQYSRAGQYYAAEGRVSVDLAEDSVANAVESAVPDDVSQTNLQETGVDEADVVKTASDGTMFVLNGRYLSRIDAFPPAAMATTATLDLVDLTGGYFHDMFFSESDNRLVAIGHRSQQYASEGDNAGSSEAVDAVAWGYGDIVVAFVNTEASSLALDRSVALSGYYVASRRIGDRLHLVSRFEPHAYDAGLDDDFYQLAAEYQSRLGQYKIDTKYNGLSADALAGRLRTSINASVASADDAQLLPQRETAGADQNHLACSDIARPELTLSPGLLVVTSVDLIGEEMAATAVANNAWLTYASTEHLYVVQTSQGWFWGWDQAAQSAIYRFGISESSPVYEGFGAVPGWILNSFSMSERADYLRVFTTENVNTDSNTLNHLFVLQNRANDLTTAAEIRGLAPGETVQSARFVDDMAYLVTFRQVDPLFAFDLSDPLKPTLDGELKIPGFSTYMHPLTTGYLLTIGRDGDDAGLSGDVAIQIFDVRDPAAPVLAHKHVLGGLPNSYAWSPAEYDHHAFTYYAPRGILAVPLMVYGSTGNDFSGIVALKIDIIEGIVELGRVDHADMAYATYCQGATDTYVVQDCDAGYYVWAAMPSRTVIMTSGDDTFLYSISRLGVKATKPDDADDVLGSTTLPQGDYGWWWY